MCVWTKKRGSMNAVVLIASVLATPCPKSLHGKGEKWIARNIYFGPGLATADDCDDGEEVSRVRLRYPMDD